MEFQYRYHPDPVASGSVRVSEAECACCHERRGYVDAVLGGRVPQPVIDEVMFRTPGSGSWQGEEWPTCRGDATAFKPAGIAEIRKDNQEWDGFLMEHIVHGPTADAFVCLCTAGGITFTSIFRRRKSNGMDN